MYRQVLVVDELTLITIAGTAGSDLKVIVYSVDVAH